jgi:hypothetical protein
MPTIPDPEPEGSEPDAESPDPTPEIPDPEPESSDSTSEISGSERRPAKKTRYSRPPRHAGRNARNIGRRPLPRAESAAVIPEQCGSGQPAPSTAIAAVFRTSQEASRDLSNRSQTPQLALLPPDAASTFDAQREESIISESVDPKIQICLEGVDISQITVLRERYGDVCSLWSPDGRNVALDDEEVSDKLQLLWRNHETTSDQLDASAICLAFINLLFAGYQKYIIRTRAFQPGIRGCGKPDKYCARITIAMRIWGSDHEAKHAALKGAIVAGEKIRVVSKILTIAIIFLVGARLST